MFLKPNANDYNPDDDLQQPGTFLAKCVGVRCDIPHRVHQGKHSIAITFELCDKRHPQLIGKRTAIMCTQSLYVSRKGGRKALLVLYLEQAGFQNPENGCDPDKMIGREYVILCELYNGKAFVRGLRPSVPEDHTPRDAGDAEIAALPAVSPASGELPF